MHRPIVEGALPGRLAGDVPPPARHAVDDGDVGGDVAAVEQGHPEMTGRVMPIVIGLRMKNAAADAHALEIDNRLGEHREARRRRPVRTGIEVLAQRHRELVIDPAMRRIPLPGVAIFGRNVRSGFDMRKILQAPGIGFPDRHKSDHGRRTTADGRRKRDSVVGHLSSVVWLRNAWTLNSPSVQAASGDQPLPCASAWNESTEYL